MNHPSSNLVLSEDGLSMHGVQVPWSDVVTVSAHNIDAMTKWVCYLVLDFSNGEFVEFCSEGAEWSVMLDHLGDFLPLPDGWQTVVRRLASSKTSGDVSIWERTSAPPARVVSTHATKLLRYFEGVAHENQDPHRQRGAHMCREWLRLASGSVRQEDIDQFVRELEAEEAPGSAWLELDMQFRVWARARGLEA